MTGEIFLEYRECFNELCATCRQYQISKQLLIQYLYEGLLPIDRNMVDDASGEALVNKTSTPAGELFNVTVQNTQQFKHRKSQFKKVNELSSGPSVES